MSPPNFKNILITGASNGLGAALAAACANPGVHIGLIGRNEDGLARTSALCSTRGATVSSAKIDVRDRDKLMQWIAAFDDAHPLDLVIANAGVMHRVRQDQLPEPASMINEMFAINFTGVTDTVNPLLQRLSARGRGHVAIISSLSAYRGLPAFPAYAASKAALKAYYEALRGVYAGKGVSISVVCPSYVRTDMTAGLKVNRFMLMDVDRAAARIMRGIDRGQSLISFPWHHAFGLRLLSLLPERLIDRILSAK